MKVEGRRKQIALFLVAILLPVIVLVALTLRIVKQERELDLKRADDERRQVAAEIGRDLTSRLDGLARGEASAIAEEPRRLARRDYLNPEVVLVARINDARLILPWEAGSKAVTSMPLERDSEFSRVLRQAESAEFASKNFSLAAERYRRAASSARFPGRGRLRPPAAGPGPVENKKGARVTRGVREGPLSSARGHRRVRHPSVLLRLRAAPPDGVDVPPGR